MHGIGLASVGRQTPATVKGEQSACMELPIVSH